MNTSTITDKLPIDSISEQVADSVHRVADSVHRVGEHVPDHIPETVIDAVNDGVAQSRRFGRQLADHIPGRRHSSNTKRWVILATVLGLVGVALVVWRVRSTRSDAAGEGRDGWSTNAGSVGATDRVVA